MTIAAFSFGALQYLYTVAPKSIRTLKPQMKRHEGHCIITALQNIKARGIYFKTAQEHISSTTYQKNVLLDFKNKNNIFLILFKSLLSCICLFENSVKQCYCEKLLHFKTTGFYFHNVFYY